MPRISQDLRDRLRRSARLFIKRGGRIDNPSDFLNDYLSDSAFDINDYSARQWRSLIREIKAELDNPSF